MSTTTGTSTGTSTTTDTSTNVAAPPRQIRVVIQHPDRAWAEMLETLVRDGLEMDVLVAHPNWDWVQAWVARRGGDVALVVVEGHPDLAQVRQLLVTAPDLRVVALSESRDPELLVGAVRAGVLGWLRPTASSTHLDATLRGALAGETHYPPDLLTVVLDIMRRAERTREESATVLSRLSERELEVLACLASGMSRNEIGEKFRLSPHTVRTHVNHVLRKLGVHSSLAAVSLFNKSTVPGS